MERYLMPQYPLPKAHPRALAHELARLEARIDEIWRRLHFQAGDVTDPTQPPTDVPVPFAAGGTLIVDQPTRESDSDS
jgi:hypothetical protein